MILVDSSVWIDYFRGIPTPQTELLDTLLDREPIAIGDLILAEVLQGFQEEKQFKAALTALEPFEVVTLGGQDIAVQAARNYRALRLLGITVRKTIDTIIATRCIQSKLALLHAERDFQPFADHLGLVEVYAGPSK